MTSKQVQRAADYIAITKDYKMNKLVHTPETGGSLSGQAAFISAWEYSLISCGIKHN